MRILDWRIKRLERKQAKLKKERLEWEAKRKNAREKCNYFMIDEADRILCYIADDIYETKRKIAKIRRKQYAYTLHRK